MISFVVPAHNEEAFIARSVAAIHAAALAAGEPYEIIVVDDSSTDATATIARAGGAQTLRVEHRHIAATRNAGGRAAVGDVLFFIDADTFANEHALRASLEALRQGAVAGGCVFRFDVPMPWWARIPYTVGVAVARKLRMVGGCFLFCTRDAFQRVGGFSERYYAGEELFFIAALKRHGAFVVPGPCVVTSARKLWTVSIWSSLRMLLRIALFGPAACRRREGLEIWYGPRTSDDRYEALRRHHASVDR